MRGSGCPVDHEAMRKSNETAPAPKVSECPVVHEGPLDPRNQMPSDLDKQKPSPGQQRTLSTERMTSSIPREEEGKVWVYPSPQMFYNAMKRKGWRPREEDMSIVVAIHNAVNERTWLELRRWELTLHPECTQGPKLVSIKGLSSHPSPKARFWGLVGGGQPFDRHDWVIDRCGVQVRYIIDYWDAPPVPGKAASMHLDVRPALDSAGAVWDRCKMAMRAMAGSAQPVPNVAGNDSTLPKPVPLNPPPQIQKPQQSQVVDHRQ